MSINTNDLNAEREVLVKDFEHYNKESNKLIWN